MISSIPWISLGVSLIVTTIVWVTFIDLDRQTHELEFFSIAEKNAQQIQDRLQTHEQVLMGFEGLFSASILVEPIEFTHFFEIQKIKDRFPDSQGVGYIEYIYGETEKNELIKRLTEEGLDFDIHPKGTKSEYYPVVFLEPQDFRNKRAIGFDVYSEEIRQHAIDQAIKTGEITLTGKIILVQETEKDIQNGFLMLLPVYEYVEEGSISQKFQGFVYSVFRMNDFIDGTLDTSLFEHIQVRIYDNSPEPENLFFDSSHMTSVNGEKIFSESLVVDFGDRQWFIDFQGSLPEPHEEDYIQIIIPVMGYTMSFLLFYTFILFSKNISLTKNMLKKEKITVVGQLSSRFSHDIRNPLSNIRMAVELLQKNNKIVSNDYTKEKFQIISKNLDRISHQVDDVLDFIRTHPMEKTRGNLNSCLSESIGNMNIPKNVKINFPSNNLRANVDFFQIQIVFKNLINNAIQSIDNQEGSITIRFLENPTDTIIEIEDTGSGFHGIDPSEIFEPLTTTKLTGTGLGLVSCKQIIESHGGTISVKTKPTVFTISLPKK